MTKNPVSTTTLKRRLSGVGPFVRRMLKAWHVPGAAVAVVTDREVLLAAGFGLRDVRRRLPVEPTTTFAIGSCTKAVVATGLGLMVADGKLTWDTPVREVLTGFRLADSVATAQATVRDLLCHRTGLPRHDGAWYGSPADRETLFARLRHLPPSRGFRDRWQYQNLMYMVAGMVLEAVGGAPWPEIVNRRIVRPLGMEGVYFSEVDMARSPEMATGYDLRGKRTVRVPFRNIDPVGAAGAINAPVVAMAKWVQLQLGGGRLGRKRIVPKKILREIHTPQVVYPDLASEELLDACYGFGWIIQPYRGRRMIHHSGSIDGFNARCSFMPRENLGVVVLTNVSGSSVPPIVVRHVYDRLLGLEPIPWHQRLMAEKRKEDAIARRKMKRPARPTRPTHRLSAFAGTYRNPGYGEISFTHKRGRLTFHCPELNSPMLHETANRFRLRHRLVRGRAATFRLDDDGNVGAVAVKLEPLTDAIVFTRADDAERSPVKRTSG